jgi:hypothetical protein
MRLKQNESNATEVQGNVANPVDLNYLSKIFNIWDTKKLSFRIKNLEVLDLKKKIRFLSKIQVLGQKLKVLDQK